jgi:hypothetical protein
LKGSYWITRTGLLPNEFSSVEIGKNKNATDFTDATDLGLDPPTIRGVFIQE